MLSMTFSSEPRKNGAEAAAPGGERPSAAGPQAGPGGAAERPATGPVLAEQRAGSSRPANDVRAGRGGPGAPESNGTAGGQGHSGPDRPAQRYLTLFKKDMTRFWPLWVVYAALWFLLIPLEIFNQGEYLARTYAGLGMTGWAGHQAMQMVCDVNGAVVSAIYGLLCAMAVWSYLYSARPANMTHALPVRREGQFAAHFLSGSAFFVLPHAVIAALTLIAGLATGSRGDLLNILGAMGILSLLCLFFFSLATLCAFVTGHLLALPVFYLILNFLVYGLAGLLDRVLSLFLFGPTTRLSGSAAVHWLTPAANLIRSNYYGAGLRWFYNYTLGDVTHSAIDLGGIPQPENGSVPYTITTQVHGLRTVLIYAAVGLALAGLALLLYRRRHLESAGDVVAVPWLRPVFQYGVAFCAALAGAYILADLLGRADRTILTVLLVLWGIIGFFAARMLLQKSLRIFKTGWKGALAVAAAIAVLCLGLSADVLGLEQVIPRGDQVASVYVTGPDSMPSDTAHYPSVTLEDPALIEKLLSVHQTVIDHRKELKANLDARRTNIPVDGHDWKEFTVQYTLENGDFLRRSYDLAVAPEELADPDSVASALSGLLADTEFNRLNYELDDVEANRLTEVAISGLENAEKGEVTFYSPLSDYDALEQQAEDAYIYEYESDAQPAEGPTSQVETRSGYGLDLRPATTEELAALWRAVLDDFEAGNLGRRWLFANSDEFNENTCSASLEFYWHERVEQEDGEAYYRQNSVTIQLTPQAANTLKALEELGLFEDGAYIADYDGQQVYPE